MKSIISYAYKIMVIFIGRQKNKSLLKILYEIYIRFLSLILFPILWIVLYLVGFFKKIKIGFLYHERLGHLAHNTDLFLRKKSIGLIPDNNIYIFFVYSPANRQLVKMFKRNMLLFESEFFSKLLSPISIFNTRFYAELPFSGNEYEIYNKSAKQLNFTENEISIGKERLKVMGVDEKDWYVCIFSRDHAYYKAVSPETDISYSDHRNANINTYELAIKHIVNLGGFVLRMGSHIENKLLFHHENVIEYASEYRDDFMDVYISAHCKFYIGNASGATDLAVIFDRPLVGVNWMPIGYCPFGKNSVFIPKNIVKYGSKQGVVFSMRLAAFLGEQVGATMCPEKILKIHTWELLDNTAEEILDVVIEMMEILNGKRGNDYEYESLLQKYFLIIPEGNIYKSNKTPIGRKYLLNLSQNGLLC